ncbi:MAG: ribosome maturation factor RimP [Trueperaceae bacterium]
MELGHAAAEVLTPLGFEVLELTVGSKGKEKRVLLRIDRLDEGIVSIDDVAVASEAFGLELDRLDPFDRPYALEVESPGPQRPLTRARHFQRFHDLLVKVRAGDESFTGRVRKVDDDLVTFEVGKDERVVRVSELESARLAEWPADPR